MAEIKRIALLEKFQCLGDKCEDTCCRGWGMQLDLPHKELYEKKAPELLSAVSSGEAALIMKRDETTDYCVKYDNGLCGIHKKYGTDFLGDACHFYPRITRQFGLDNVMAASMSCPEVARLGLFGEEPFSQNTVPADRLPYSLKNYLTPEMQLAGLDNIQAEKIMQSFIDLAGDESITPERIMARIISVSISLSNLPFKSWAEATPFMIRTADGRLRPPEPDENDQARLLQNMAGLIFAAKKTSRPRLEKTLGHMESALGLKIDWLSLNLMRTARSKLPELQKLWNASRPQMDKILRRWLQLQLSEVSWPFAGLGHTLKDRATILAVRFATVKLALLAGFQEGGKISDELTVEIIQSLARFLDHLADPTLSMELYTQADWPREARLRSLIGDQ